MMKDKLETWAVLALYWGLIQWFLIVRQLLSWVIVYPPCWALVKLGQAHDRALERRTQALWNHPPDVAAARASHGLAIVTAGFAVLLSYYIDAMESFSRVTRRIFFYWPEVVEDDAPPE